MQTLTLYSHGDPSVLPIVEQYVVERERPEEALPDYGMCKDICTILSHVKQPESLNMLRRLLGQRFSLCFAQELNAARDVLQIILVASGAECIKHDLELGLALPNEVVYMTHRDYIPDDGHSDAPRTTGEHISVNLSAVKVLAQTRITGLK